MEGDRSMEKLYFYACKVEAKDFSKIVNGAVIEEEFSRPAQAIWLMERITDIVLKRIEAERPDIIKKDVRLEFLALNPL